MINFKSNPPIALVVLDGFGYRSTSQGNAVSLARMPTWSKLCNNYPYTLLKASGEFVGLLPGYAGNSEVGHITLGAGRVVDSDLKRFHEMIHDGSLSNHPLLKKKLRLLKESGKALHIMGLLSDGGVHSHEEHLYALLACAKQEGVAQVYVHAFLDGRDVPAQSATTYLNHLEKKIEEISCAELVSLHGRFYAMDRDHNWDRTKASYDILTGKTPATEKTWQLAIKESYEHGVSDEFFKPIRLRNKGFVQPGDGVIFFNLRPDRARQLTECFIAPSFTAVERPHQLKKNDSLAFFISAVEYSNKYGNAFLLSPLKTENTLLDALAPWSIETKSNVFIIAESEKYAHVTYFFRGMREIRLPHEIAVIVQSIKARNYVDNPHMSAQEITSQVTRSLLHEKASFYLINYANADMVGHSGNLRATVKACECLDQQLAILFNEFVEKRNGTLYITADHGNAEEMLNEKTGQPQNEHTTNSVPFLMAGKQFENKKIRPLNTRGLASVAPTILTHMGLTIFDEMKKEIIEVV